MNPIAIATLAITIGSKLAEAYQRHQAANAALKKMLEENREPTAEEWAQLRAAGAEADERLDELLG